MSRLHMLRQIAISTVVFASVFGWQSEVEAVPPGWEFWQLSDPIQRDVPAIRPTSHDSPWNSMANDEYDTRFSLDTEPWPSVDPEIPLLHSGDRDMDLLGRHVGRGEPLEGTSWLNRPYHVGWLVGGLFGDDLIDRQVEQEEDLFGGYRVGWDFDHYWGTEIRVAFANVNVLDPGDSVSDRTARNHFYDLNVLYYPWGDSAWRPFISAGMGLGRFQFVDGLGNGYDETLVQVPLGLGCKYYFRNWLALRITLADNLAVGGSGLSSLHQMSLTGDIEVHFSGRYTRYYPW